MHELIVVEKATGHEIGRRPLHPSERYDYYRAHMEGEPLCFAGIRYTTQSMAWRLPEEDLMAGVTFHSYDRYADD